MHGNGGTDAKLIAAAEAAASWARARRAAWTGKPVEVDAPRRGHEPLPPIEFEPAPAPRPARGPVPAPPPAPAQAKSSAAPLPSGAAPAWRAPAPPHQPVPPPPSVGGAPASGKIALQPISTSPVSIAPKPSVDAAPPPFVAATQNRVDDRPSPSGVPFKLIATVAIAAALLFGAVIGWPRLSNMFATNGKPAQDDAMFVGPRQEARRCRWTASRGVLHRSH